MALNEHGIESVEMLKRDPIAALDAYSPPVDWKMGLHKDLIERRNRFSAPIEMIDTDKDFLKDLKELLYAWKVGTRGVRVVSTGSFERELKKTAKRLDDLKGCRIENLKFPDIETVRLTSCLWDIVNELRITTAKEARLVSGSKAIHHLLPDLVPPMDSNFTSRFFQGREGFRTTERSFFRKVYPQFVRLARELVKNEEFMARVGVGFNTSLTKTLNNAIIGFVTREDMAMAHAIEEGMKTPVVSKQELLDILQPKHVYRS